MGAHEQLVRMKLTWLWLQLQQGLNAVSVASNLGYAAEKAENAVLFAQNVAIAGPAVFSGLDDNKWVF